MRGSDLRLTPLRVVLDGVVDRLGLAEKAAGYRALALWAEAAGPDIARRTAPSRFIEGVLYVDVESPAWASQLTFMREILIERLNERLGGGKAEPSHEVTHGAVREIRFRVRSVRKTRGEALPVGLALVRLKLRCLPPDGSDDGDPVPSLEIRASICDERLLDAFSRLLSAHRRLETAKLLSGWERCGTCGRVYESGGKCPCLVDRG